MIQLEFETTIQRPIEEVFARLVDIDSYEDWLPHSLIFRGGGLKQPEEEVTEGTEFVDVTPIGKFHGRVTEFEPPTRVAFEQNLSRRGDRVFSSRPSYVLQQTDDGTLVTHHAQGELYGPLSFTEPVVRMLASHERQRTFDQLKRSLEDDR